MDFIKNECKDITHKNEFSKDTDKLINNWWFCTDAYNDLCATFEANALFAELRIYPNFENYSLIIISGAEYKFMNMKKVKRTLLKGSKQECETKLKEIIAKKRPEAYIKKIK